jgi:hypothetical protein
MRYLYLTLIFLVFSACSQADTASTPVNSDPITITLNVKNSTDSDMRCHKTYGVDKSDVWVEIAAGASAALTSNTHSPSGTVYTCYPVAPKNIPQPNPSDGNFQMSYGYWDGAPHVTCDNDCNKGYPTDKIHYQGNNWKYILKWKSPEDVVNNSVEFLTGAL